MTAFTPGREQDAWGTIRGFVYQVDITIRRWVALSADAELHLECGEDIDRVARAIDATASAENGPSRLLEQIKYRQDPITLNTPDVIRALAGFHQTRTKNSSLNTAFLFTTNASVTGERGRLWRATSPGITVWNHLREGLLDEVHPDAVAELQRIVWMNGSLQEDESEKGDSATKEASALLRSCAHGDADAFRRLVEAVEWSHGNPSASSIREDNLARLRDRLRIYEDRTAAAYDAVFAYVFRLLATKGAKVLAARDLDSVGQRILTAADVRINALMAQLSHLRQEVHSLELSTSSRFDAVDEEIRTLRLSAGEPIHLTAPPPGKLAVARSQVMQSVRSELDQRPCVMLVGPVGAGKTELARCRFRKR